MIIRSILEQLLQLCYFTSISKDEKNLLVYKEHIRIYKKFYDREINSGEDGCFWQGEYDKYLEVLGRELPDGFPVKLSSLNRGHIEPFPSAEKMCESAEKIMPWSKPKQWNHDYKYFCEETHNGLMINTQRKPKNNYRQNLGYCLSCCMNMLKITDRYYLNYETKDIVVKVLESTNINNIKSNL